MTKSKKWENYEQVSAYLLDQLHQEFGLEKVEGKQKVKGFRSGTNYIIEAKGILENGEGIVIIECRDYSTKKQNQDQMGGLAYRIIDTNAKGGIIVSKLGLQKGAKKIADRENIVSVFIDPKSTPQEFTIEFLNKIFVGAVSTEHLDGTANPTISKSLTKLLQLFRSFRHLKTVHPADVVQMAGILHRN